MMRLLSILFILFLIVVTTESAPKSALVTKVPGFNGTFPSKHYSGYVTVDEDHGRNLFYYFVQSEKNPATDPVVLWLNGGPGCSNMDGFVYEHGPFNFEAGKTKEDLPKLHINPYSWSKVSNIIYLDSPAGVGFSYSKNKTDYQTDDFKTAFDSHIFLLKWFQLFPEFQSNPFFVSGESYAGVYVPTLASEIVRGNDANQKPAINLKGYLVGNGVTDQKFDVNALVPFAHGMALISDQLFEEVTAACKGNFYQPTDESCKTKLGHVHKKFSLLNAYNILEPCYHGDDGIAAGKLKLPASFQELGKTEKRFPVRKRIYGRAWPLRTPVKPGYVPSWPELSKSQDVPCIDDTIATVWLNDASVRKAIHTEKESVIGKWELCTGRLDFEHDAGSMIEYHRNLTMRGISALIYSGDHDMCIPYTGSEAWTRSMGYDVVDEWRTWMSNDQVAGYVQGYANNLTFLTVKGSGHTVPEYKPREALDFYSRFLAGNKI